MGRRCVRLLLVGAAISMAAAVPPASAADVDGTSATFADSVGVGVNPFANDTSYWDRTRTRQYLDELGIKHLRGWIPPDLTGDPERVHGYQFSRDLAADGYKWMLITGDPDPWDTPSNYLQSRRALLDPDEMLGVASSLEGPNEYDLREVQGDWFTELPNPAWGQTLFAYQTQLYAAFKADPDFGHLPHYGPSFAEPVRRGAYATFLPGSGRNMDAPNAHIYPGERTPEEVVTREIRAVTNEFSDVDQAASLAGQPTAVDSRFPVVSEFGFHTAVNDNDPHRGVTERAQSINLLRGLLVAFEEHAVRTFVHELLDRNPDPLHHNHEDHFGLVEVAGDPEAVDESTWTFRKKPAFDALKELMEITRDTGTGAEVTPNYTLSGATGLREVVLTRRDGTYYVVLWRPEPVFLDGQGDQFPGTVSVTLNVPGGAAVSTEQPHSERSFTSRGSGTSFSLQVGAEPLFVRVDP